jgi:hypothetical protein
MSNESARKNFAGITAFLFKKFQKPLKVELSERNTWMLKTQNSSLHSKTSRDR